MVLNNIQPVVTNQMNAELTSDINDEEIRKALFSIGATRAHTLTNLPPYFINNVGILLAQRLSLKLKTFSKQICFLILGIIRIYV